MYISIFVLKKLSFNKKMNSTVEVFFWKGLPSLNSPVQISVLEGPKFTQLPSFFWKDPTSLHWTPQLKFFFGRTSLHWTPQFKISFGSTSLHWTPQLKFFWKYFTSLNSPVEVFLEWFHFTELPSWSFFGMISLYWTPQLKFFWNDFTELNSPV